MIGRTLTASLTLALLTAASLPAQRATRANPAATPAPVVNPAAFVGMQFRHAGHSVGGRVTAVAGVPSQSRTYYMGAASGGLFRTTACL